MDKNNPHLLLRVPTPNASVLSFCDSNPAALTRWIAGLPKANIGETARLLYQGLTELNQLDTPNENRLRLLELLRPEVHYVCTHLERHFLNQAVVLDERPRKIANLCQALQGHLAIGYKLVIVRELLGSGSGKQRAQLLSIALQRASSAIHASLLRTHQLYCPPAEGLWLELHQLHRIASQHQLQHNPVRDALSSCEALSCEQIYLSALLLGTARCNQMRQNHIALVARALDDWNTLASLQPADDPHSLFAIAPQLDGPPRYRSLFPANERAGLIGLDSHALVDALRAHLMICAEPSQQSPLNVPAGLPEELLQHLEGAWGDIAERTFQRTPGRGGLFVCIGMSALHFNLAGQRSFSQVLEKPVTQQPDFAPEEPSDIWSGAFDAQRETDWEQRLTMDIQYQSPNHPEQAQASEEASEQHPSYELPIINHSPGGYCLSWPREIPSQLQAGELLGLQDAPGQAWGVAMVRWIRQVRGGGTQMGVELIAPHAQPCGLQLLRKNGQHSQFLRALLLPEIPVISRPATLIAPRLPFQEGSKVLINIAGNEHRAVLERRQTASGSFTQFRYHLLETASVTGSSEPVKAAEKPKDDDFESLWKLL